MCVICFSLCWRSCFAGCIFHSVKMGSKSCLILFLITSCMFVSISQRWSSNCSSVGEKLCESTLRSLRPQISVQKSSHDMCIYYLLLTDRKRLVCPVSNRCLFFTFCLLTCHLEIVENIKELFRRNKHSKHMPQTPSNCFALLSVPMPPENWASIKAQNGSSKR